MIAEEQLIIDRVENEIIYYKPTFYYSEQHLAKLLLHKLENRLEVDEERVKIWINRYTASRKIQLSPQQSISVAKAASQKIMILTGGPGTGKTFVTDTIIKLWKAMGKKILCAAPTGRNEITLAWATSIHKSQGSEYPVVILPLYTQHYIMLSRNLFYTLFD